MDRLEFGERKEINDFIKIIYKKFMISFIRQLVNFTELISTNCGDREVENIDRLVDHT